VIILKKKESIETSKFLNLAGSGSWGRRARGGEGKGLNLRKRTPSENPKKGMHKMNGGIIREREGSKKGRYSLSRGGKGRGDGDDEIWRGWCRPQDIFLHSQCEKKI